VSDYGPVRDGRIFLVRRPPDAAPVEPKVNVVLNWFSDLRRQLGK
jgi:hypothetical protein